MTDDEIQNLISHSKEEVTLIVKGRADEILQAIGQTQATVLDAIEGTRQQIDVLYGTVKPELRYLREVINGLFAFFKKMGH